VGSKAALAGGIHTDPATKNVEFFKDQTAAQAAFDNPFGGEIGNRNDLRGPHFWNADVSLLKDIKLHESQKLVLRADAFNILNHENFQLPGVNINGGTFGQLTTTQGAPRQLQMSLRFEF
jgi:hypothetical protein